MTARISKIALLALAVSLAAAMLAGLLPSASAQGGSASLSFPSPGVTLKAGGTVTVEITAANLEAGNVDTVQVGLQHIAGDIEVTGFRCAGIFDGATPTDLIDVTPGESVAFTCSAQGAPSAGDGVVAEVDLTRSGSGDATVSFLTAGPFRTALISQGSELPLTIVNDLQVSDVLWRPAGFYFEPSSVSLADGASVDIDIFTGQIDIASASSVQVTVVHDSSVIAITGADCIGLYDGASITPLASVEGGSATSFVCSLAGAPADEYGAIARITAQRVGAGDAPMSFLGAGPFRTAFIEGGVQVSQGALDSMTVSDPGAAVTPSPSPSPTATATATATTPAGGGGGGGGAPQATNTPVPAGPSAPSVPLNVAATPGDASVEIAWSSPLSNGGAPISSYRIVNLNTAAATTVLAPASSILITGLTNGTPYTFQVQAGNLAGFGPSALVGPVIPATEPSAPLNVQAALNGSDVIVTWAAPSSDGGSPITGYVVKASNGTEVTAAGAATQATVTGLAAGQAFSFTVNAVNAVGEGPASAVAGPVAIPAASGSPGDAPAVTASVPQSAGANSALSAAAGAALGPGVTAPNEPITYSSSDGELKALIELDGVDSSVSGPVQLNVVSDELDIETDASGNGFIRTVIGEGLSVTGSASVSIENGGISIDIGDALLAYSPPAPGEPGVLSGIEFSVGLNSLPPGAGLTTTFSTTLPQELAGAVFAIGSSGGSVIGDPDADVGGVVIVTKSGLSQADLGDNTVTMSVTAEWYEARAAQGKDIIITKISDSGEVFTEEAQCVPAGAGYLCTATFTGPAGGFSTFGLFAVSVPLPPTATPSPPAPTPTAPPAATPAAAQPTATASPTATLSPSPTRVPSPQPQPTASLNPLAPSSGGGFPLWAWIVLGIMGLAAIRAVLYLASRTRR